jgi:hypothetical protein
MSKTRSMLGDICGWYGTGAILLAYVLVSFSVLRADSWAYQALNLSGALGFVVLGIVKKVYETVTLNTVWAVVALAAIVRMFLG